MKYVVCIPDGCADEPVDELDGKTPLDVAYMPTLQRLTQTAQLGRAAVIPKGMAPGSDVGNMSIFGYDPAKYHTGRAPIEAAALGLSLRPDQMAFRCNLVTVSPDGIMEDFAGGHPTTEEASEIIAALQEELGGEGISFHPGVQYRHIMIAPKTLGDAYCTPPHDISDKQAVAPTGPAADALLEIMNKSRNVLSKFSSKATQVWLWGQGTQPEMPSFETLYQKRASLVTAVDLVKGLGVLTGVETKTVDGATGWFDTNYEGKRDCALETLVSGADIFILHVEATDEAGHAGNVQEKIRALENWDSRILTGLVEGLNAMGEWRMLMLPDHATPLRLKTHTPDPVPYFLTGSNPCGAGGTYSETGVKDLPLVAGHELMGMLLQH